MKLTISLAQIQITLGDTAANLNKATEWTAEAGRTWLFTYKEVTG